METFSLFCLNVYTLQAGEGLIDLELWGHGENRFSIRIYFDLDIRGLTLPGSRHNSGHYSDIQITRT